MRLLLDTHILLSLIERGTGALPKRVQALLRDPDNEHHFSAASFWEIAIKSRSGKPSSATATRVVDRLTTKVGVAGANEAAITIFGLTRSRCPSADEPK
jgi:PIN domain nuclease of toxin-antitoxin system